MNKKIIMLLCILVFLPTLILAESYTYSTDSLSISKIYFNEINISNTADAGINTFIYYFYVKEDGNFIIDTDTFNITGIIDVDWLKSNVTLIIFNKNSNVESYFESEFYKALINYKGIDYCFQNFYITGDVTTDISGERLPTSCSYVQLIRYMNYSYAIPTKMNITSSNNANILRLSYLPYETIIENNIKFHTTSEEQEEGLFNLLPFNLGNGIYLFIDIFTLFLDFGYFIILRPYLILILIWTLMIPIAIVKTKTFFGLINEILKMNGRLIKFVLDIIVAIFDIVMSLAKQIIDLIPFI